MAKDYAESFYKSTKWIKCRRSYIANRITIDGGLCEKCQEQTGYIVHHKEKITPANINNPDITLNHKNLSYECKQCHDKNEGHGIRKKGISPLCSFDKDGQPISLREIDQSPL